MLVVYVIITPVILKRANLTRGKVRSVAMDVLQRFATPEHGIRALGKKYVVLPASKAMTPLARLLIAMLRLVMVIIRDVY